jgi:hypothetical protein
MCEPQQRRRKAIIMNTNTKIAPVPVKSTETRPDTEKKGMRIRTKIRAGIFRGCR